MNTTWGLLLKLTVTAMTLLGCAADSKSKNDTSVSRDVCSSWTLEYAQYPPPNTTLVDLNQDRRFRVFYDNSLRKDVPRIVLVYWSFNRPGLNRVELTKGASIDFECHHAIIEHYLVMPGQQILCIKGCPRFKDCNCAYQGRICSLD